MLSFLSCRHVPSTGNAVDFCKVCPETERAVPIVLATIIKYQRGLGELGYHQPRERTVRVSQALISKIYQPPDNDQGTIIIEIG